MQALVVVTTLVQPQWSTFHFSSTTSDFCSFSDSEGVGSEILLERNEAERPH